MALQHESEYEYAGFWVRVGASLIDTILLLLVTVPLAVGVFGWAYLGTPSVALGPADILINYVLPALLVIILWLKFSTTPGKMAIGATIVDARTGGKPSLGQFVLRYVGYYLSAIPLLLGMIWVGFDPRKQGWHDKLAGTVVVRRKAGAAQPVHFENAGGAG